MPARYGKSAAALAGMAPAAILVAVAVWEIVATARAGHDVPGDPAWEEAAAYVRDHLGEDDLVVFAPAWIDPVGRMHLGGVIDVGMAARMDAGRYGTIWELSIRGARAPETRGLAAAETRRFDGVTVRRYEKRAAQVVFDFVAGHAEATTRGGTSRVRLEEVGFEPHRCVRAIPPPDRTVAIRYDDVPVGETLVGYVGLADVFKRRDVRDPGRLEVRVDGEVATSVEFGVDDGWVRFEADTAPGTADVVFAATAVGPKARDRLICFAAEARR